MKLLDLIQNEQLTQATSLFRTLENELSRALTLYWSSAGRILDGSGIRLMDPPPDYASFNRNFFSALFLYSYHRAGIPEERRIIYAAVNQCLRGMVTGCDNLLDDEYKSTLLTDLPASGVKFRSVLDIMVSDRILFEILLTSFNREDLSLEGVLAGSSATLRALTRSGAQEAAEEGGTRTILDPRDVLSEVHHYKTGLLFQCPWAVPRLVENLDEKVCASLMDSLYRIGMGCQVMDDMVDFSSDLSKSRHNYLISLIHHGSDPVERVKLEQLMASRSAAVGAESVLDFPQALGTAAKTARSFLRDGLRSLFPEPLAYLVEPVITTLATLIQADRFMCGP